MYINELLIFNMEKERNYKCFKIVLERFQDNQLFPSSRKCQTSKEELYIYFLGMLIGKNRITVDPDKVKVLQDFPIPNSAMDVWSFVCETGNGHGG